MILENLVKTELSWQQLLFVSLAYLFGIISIILFLRKKISVSILFLFTAALILRFLIASFDPFLNLWDEQFHALVAKNLMKHPLTPLLYEHPLISYDPAQWINNHVWLHKQPWFLWQISIFLKVFGTNEFIVRIPTVIMCSLLVPAIYRIGALTTNRLTGWLAAFFYTFSFFWVNFCAGSTFSDHNDAAFIFYVTLSIWSWLEYRYSKKPGWIFLIGIFSGIAILNKWLPGLLVYAGWFVSLLMMKKPESRFMELKRIILSFIITVAIALPWQLYIHYRFPVESLHELKFNALHFVHPIEGHGGGALYYIEMLVQQYGGPMIFLFILAGLILFFGNIRERGVRYGILAMLSIVYLFFSIAATKMPLFTSMTLPIIFLSLGALGDRLISNAGNIVKPRWLNILLLGLLCYIGINGLNFKQICEWHSSRSSGWAQWHKAAIVDRYFWEKYHVNNAVVFNCGGFNSIQFMFYNGNTAYGPYPSFEDYKRIKDQKIKIFVFTDPNIPAYLKEDPRVTKIYLSGFQY